MQERVVAQIAEREFAAAMCPCQGEMPKAPKTRKNDHTGSRYADLEAIHQVAKPIYARHGFSIVFSQTKPEVAGWIKVVAQIRHAGGHTEEKSVELPPDTVGSGGKANKTQVQGIGSTLTYARRYLECLIFNIDVGDDNDGNAGLPAQQGPARAPKPPQAAPAPAPVTPGPAPHQDTPQGKLWKMTASIRGSGTPEQKTERLVAWLRAQKILGADETLAGIAADQWPFVLDKAEIAIGGGQ
jgi:hypothetical protein